MTKSVCLILALFIPLLLPGELAKTGSNPPFTVTGAFFAVSVPNLTESEKWYSEKLALEVIFRAPKTAAVRSAVTVMAGRGLMVELIETEHALPLSEAVPSIKDSTLIQGYTKAGVIVDDFDRSLVILRERNVPILMGPFPAHDSSRLRNFIIQDNAHNLIQFFGK